MNSNLRGQCYLFIHFIIFRYNEIKNQWPVLPILVQTGRVCDNCPRSGSLGVHRLPWFDFHAMCVCRDGWAALGYRMTQMYYILLVWQTLQMFSDAVILKTYSLQPPTPLWPVGNPEDTRGAVSIPARESSFWLLLMMARPCPSLPYKNSWVNWVRDNEVELK